MTRRSPEHELARVRKAYQRMASRYDRLDAVTTRATRRARQRIGREVGGKVLEVGIGTGATIGFYPDHIQLTGLDLSPAMMARARARAAVLGRPVELVEGNAERMGFADRSFDAVVFTLCLCTIPRPALAIGEAMRVVRPGGGLLFLEHVRSHVPPVAWAQDLLTLWTGPSGSEYFNRRTLDAVRAAGVEVVDVDRWLLGFFNLIVGRRPT